MTVADSVVAMLARDASLAGYGIDVLYASDGYAKAQMTVDESRANGHGIAHGGAVFALADTAFACAANSRLADTVTAGASITYYTPAHIGDDLVADATVRHLEGRHSLVDVTVRCGERVIAEYRGRGAVIRPTHTNPEKDRSSS
ncbi:hotdog fold thioesterase [Gordonia sp. CPCC 205515]|uniref:hotdog fold thioesterase n=1 Tax=Gordonia sp. CPCC 205515 TaxID=3140791 RepID=UPI003AF36879